MQLYCRVSKVDLKDEHKPKSVENVWKKSLKLTEIKAEIVPIQTELKNSPK